jgi:Tfp pilus assembly protein FimT
LWGQLLLFVAEPFASFTYNSATYQPMIEEKTALVNMLSGLSSAQLTTAQLSTTYTDLVCGPGKDWLFRPQIRTESKQFNNSSETARYNAIATYVNDVDDTNAATIMTKYNNELDNTYIAWSTDATLTNQNGYVRIDGPSVWIEYSVQNGIILTPKHPHSIWRDHTTDYGGTGNTLSTDETNTSISKPMIYPNPVKDFATFNFTASEKGNTKINIYDQSARLVKSIEKNNLPKGQNSVSAD